MKLINKTKNKIIAEHVEVANTVFKKMKGLLGREKIKKGEGLRLLSCNNIHSLFMKFEFDAIFIDKYNKVKKLSEKIPQWTLLKICFGADSVIELPAGTIKETGAEIGDELEFN